MATASSNQNEDHSPASTVLRIKRKRNEDPIDALILATEDAQRQDKRLKIGGEDVSKVFQLVDTIDTDAFEDAEKLPTTLDKLRALRTVRHSVKFSSRPNSEERRQNVVESRQAATKAARYKVLKTKRQYAEGLKLLDVAQDDEASAVQETSTQDADKAPLPEDEIMSKLMPMVQEYLRISGPTAQAASSEYVWDIYTLDPHAQPGANARVAELTWEESLDIFLPDEDSSSDVYDEADEDSNAEDYYTNEYPDEWEGSEAEYGSEDEYDDPYDSD